MPPALDKAPRRRPRRNRRQGLINAASHAKPLSATPPPTPHQTLRRIAQSAPAQPLRKSRRAPRVTSTRHAATRASRFIPGISDVRRPKPLSPTPPKHPLGAKPGGHGTGTRRARRTEINRIAGQLLTPNEQKTERRKQSFITGLLSQSSPVGMSLKQGQGPFGIIPNVLLKTAGNVLDVVAHDPAKQLPKLLKDTGESIVSIPSGIARTATSPKAAVTNLVKDYNRRYKPLLEGDDEAFKARLRKEGVAPEVFDLAGVASAEAGIAGRAAQTAAKGGALGKTATRIATTRPALRVSGGLVKEQPVSNNFFRNVVRAGVDATRKDVQARRASGRNASALVREAERAGEVTPITGAGRAQRKSVAQAKGRMLTSMKAEQQAEVGASTKAIRSLSKPERRAFKYAVQYGITTPQAARRVLAAHRERIPAARAALEGISPQAARLRAEMTPAELRRMVQSNERVAAANRNVPAAARRDPNFNGELLAQQADALADAAREALDQNIGSRIPARQSEIPEIDYLLENADKAFTPRLAEVMRTERARAEQAAIGDPGVALEQAGHRRVAPQAQLLGVVRREGESTASYFGRLATAQRRHGLEDPGYFPSEKRAEGVFSTFAVGGRQAVKGPSRYTGALTTTGRESTALDVLPRGIARNIKRKYNWNLVADNFDRHAFSWSKNKTIEQLKDDIERRGIDPDSVRFWNPKVFKDEQHAAAALEGRDVEADAVTPEASDVHTAAQLATNPAAFKGTSGWSLIPKGVHDEIMTDVRPSGALGRSYDIVKGKLSRVLLGNPGWLQYQVGSNALLTGLTGTGPVDVVKAQVWWRKLPEEQKRAIEPYIGVHRWYDEQTHLGATANNRMVNAYRAFKQTRFYQHPLSPRPGNVLDQLFKADNAQNNFFRKAVFYNKAKRETYRRMGQESGRIIALQERAARVLSLPPQDRMEAVVRDADTFERLAEHTTKFLGDYTTYTAKERRLLGRSVMFYGFLRYSVKFTLYTMPIEHPIVSSMLTQIGRLERDEQKKIFGADVPPWEFGNLYTQGGRKYQLARLSPFFNAVQYGEPGSLTSSLSPAVQVVLNQVASKDVTFDKPFTVKGSGQYVEKGSEIGHPASALLGPFSTRGRIATEELLRLSPYYRLAEKGGIPGIPGLYGKQTSESTLFRPDPVRYKKTTKQSREAAARNAQSAAEQRAGGSSRQLREQLLPLLGMRGQDTIRKAREFDAAQKKKKRKKKAGPPDLLGGGGNSAGQLPDLLGP